MHDPLWYKDAILYELHVKSFFDSDDDGVGDFAGLTAKLDYLQSLGVTALWLLPFYPSPLKDDGYDIADYRAINPSFGTLHDFRRFVREAHRRDLKVIVELVINHTSDQHPWFQRARHAPPGSAARNYYVWSDSDRKYSGTRIIFTDTETSNWAWDPVAQAYYWHRFFSHQPDLNFENPRVVVEVVRIMRHWLDTGVDGLRLDAVPYLVEREGTNNENLPETHDVIRRIRAALDAKHKGRMLLAEANQWPEDVRPYFGDGDECHMAFHFPLMPRIYMALAQEDRHPVTDILRQTPSIPDNCQWAIFLRNHDELTLEMVTDRERDYLWRSYATDARAKLNLGIRRRLAPLLDNDRRKVELLNSLLMSMPGTPILYYGDEIGMGDNFYLGDRNGVRTPMQWSPDRNGGFSRADPARLFLPAIMDSVYGYEAVNAEAQARSPASLLNWMRRLISVRKNYRAFGRGTISFILPKNRKVLVYLREYENETILCVVNFSRAPQAAELDLSAYRGRVPVELFGQTVFPQIGELPYFITLPGHGFYWFRLADKNDPAVENEIAIQALPELMTLVVPRGWSSLLTGESRQLLLNRALPDFLAAQRWFAGKDARLIGVNIDTAVELRDGDRSWLLLISRVDSAGRDAARYSVPLAVAWESATEDPLARLLPSALARVRQGARLGTLHDAVADERFARALVHKIAANETLDAGVGRIVFRATPNFPGEPGEDMPVARLGAEQSHSSLRFDDAMVFKLYRRVAEGVHPETEMGRHLAERTNFRNTPRVLGAIELVAADGPPTSLGVLHEFVQNQGDAWRFTSDYVMRFLDDMAMVTAEHRAEEGERHAPYRNFAHTLGRRIAELHRALAAETGDSSFDPEPVTETDVAAWRARFQARAMRAAAHLDEEMRVRIDAAGHATFSGRKSRIHGDLHLGQILVVKDDVFVIDFEGEPSLPIEARRSKDSPLRDVAGVLRSFDYAALSAVRVRFAGHAEDPKPMADAAWRWAREAETAFLEAYFALIEGCPTLPPGREEAMRLIRFYELEKALYEVGYEAANRPDWIGIPLDGVRRLLADGQGV
jgi:maltose alpha-D-glucosyltransferase/alpha-amylase